MFYLLKLLFESLITKVKVSLLKAMSQAHNYNVLIIICNLFVGLPIIFKEIQNHHGKQCTLEVSQLKEIVHYLSALRYRTHFLMGPITIYIICTVHDNIWTYFGRYQYCGQYIAHPLFVNCTNCIFYPLTYSSQKTFCKKTPFRIYSFPHGD